MENISHPDMTLLYQVDYTLTDVPKDAAYFHARIRRTNPLPYKTDYTILDGVKGKGHYVRTYMALQTTSAGWWGEGEIKFFMDGDKKFPAICGTGNEDYFCGSYCFTVKDKDGRSVDTEYTTPYAGFFTNTDKGLRRFSLYRWHIMDPIRFDEDLKVTIQALGWDSGRKYKPLQDDYSSVAFWYQTEPHAKFPKLPSKDYLGIS